MGVRMGVWQFELPDYFVARYFSELVAWAKNFKKIGPVKSIVLREGHFANVSPNAEQGAELVQVKLKAAPALPKGELRRVVLVTPARERDARNIANHCQKMRDLSIPPQTRLIEPERPWIPFLPTVQ
jgi:hypothetical protein